MKRSTRAHREEFVSELLCLFYSLWLLSLFSLFEINLEICGKFDFFLTSHKFPANYWKHNQVRTITTPKETQPTPKTPSNFSSHRSNRLTNKSFQKSQTKMETIKKIENIPSDLISKSWKTEGSTIQQDIIEFR